MRRSASPLSLVLLGSGAFLLVLATMLAWYVEPRAKRTPIDVNTTTVLKGTGSYFDQGEVTVMEGQDLTVTRRVMGNVSASERGGTAVWDVSQTIDNPTTLELDDPRRSFQWTVERWVTDRETNKPVHCCGETPGEFKGDAYLKFPFDVEETTYSWWDGTLGNTVEVAYQDRVDIQGYEGMRFTGTVEATQAGTRQVPGVLVGMPETPQVMAEEWYANSGIELVVDEATGRILRATIGPKVTLRAPGGTEDVVTLLRSEKLQFDEKTQKEQVAKADEDSSRLRLVGTTAPLGAGAAGALLTGAGVVLLARGRRPDGQDA